MSDDTTNQQDLRSVAVELAKVLRARDRDDLVARATAAVARVDRPSTIVCVVGEFKQGKSSLVNGLLGSDVCPVDDDLATSAITLIKYADSASADVRRVVDGEVVTESVPVEELGEWVSEIGNPANVRGVERVEIGVPSPILKQGLVLVDTPGMGGLGAGHAAATLAFLPFSDGLIFVSDASAELSRPEIDFLEEASVLCPTVLFALTKIDLYPHWQRIDELNGDHLQREGVDVPRVAISSHLRSEAITRRSRDLNDSSAFPALLSHIGDDVIKPAREFAFSRSMSDLEAIASLVRLGLEEERRIALDPAGAERAISNLNDAKERLEFLKGPGSRWSTVLSDSIGDLSSAVTHELRGSMRSISREMSEAVENLKTGAEWDDISRLLQAEVATAVTAAFVAVERGRLQTRSRIAELLRDEDIAIQQVIGGGRGSDAVRALWSHQSIEPEKGIGGVLKTGLAGVGGIQRGVMMFGVMGRFLPAAAAGIVATNPVIMGAGALFGGYHLMEDRKRKVAARRQKSRQLIRQFIDDVQFQVSSEITGEIRTVQRDLRDEFTDRLKELHATYLDAAKRAQQTAKEDAERRHSRLGEVEQLLSHLSDIESDIGRMKP